MKYCLIILLFLSGCISWNDDTFKSYEYDFFSIVRGKFFWEESKFVSGDTIAFQINSFNVLEDYNEFEPINEQVIELTMDNHFVINEDTIGRTENLIEAIRLLDPGMISLTRPASSGSVEKQYYYLIIQNTAKSAINLQNGYYTFYFKAKTVSGFEISDSTVIKLNNR